MTGLQQLAGLSILFIGLLAFLDRDRPREARRTYYWYDVDVGVVGRTVASTIAMLLGGALVVLA